MKLSFIVLFSLVSPGLFAAEVTITVKEARPEAYLQQQKVNVRTEWALGGKSFTKISPDVVTTVHIVSTTKFPITDISATGEYDDIFPGVQKAVAKEFCVEKYSPTGPAYFNVGMDTGLKPMRLADSVTAPKPTFIKFTYEISGSLIQGDAGCWLLDH